MASTSTSWINHLLRKPENAFLCVVDDTFIRDGFNLVGLSDLVMGYELALQTMLDETTVGKSSCTGKAGKSKATEAAAELLYGLVHARFVLTPSGVEKMFIKYKAGCFGYCPRVNCRRTNVLPIGRYNRTYNNNFIRNYSQIRIYLYH